MDSKTDFDFYVKFSKPLVLNLRKLNDRALASAWVKRLKDDTDASEKTKLEYIKLLLFVLQRKRLYSPFTQHPNELEVLAELQDENLVEVAKNMLLQENEERKNKPRPKIYNAFNSDFSADLLEYAAVQNIANFGVHGYFAVSKQTMNQWYRIDKHLLPKAAKSMLEVASGPATLTGTTSLPQLTSPEKKPPLEEPDGQPPVEEPPAEPAEPPPEAADETTEPTAPPKSLKKRSTGPPSPLIGKAPPPDDRTPPSWGSNLLEIKRDVEDEKATDRAELLWASSTATPYGDMLEETPPSFLDTSLAASYGSPAQVSFPSPLLVTPPPPTRLTPPPKLAPPPRRRMIQPPRVKTGSKIGRLKSGIPKSHGVPVPVNKSIHMSQEAKNIIRDATPPQRMRVKSPRVEGFDVHDVADEDYDRRIAECDQMMYELDREPSPRTPPRRLPPRRAPPRVSPRVSPHVSPRVSPHVSPDDYDQDAMQELGLDAADLRDISDISDISDVSMPPDFEYHTPEDIRREIAELSKMDEGIERMELMLQQLEASVEDIESPEPSPPQPGPEREMLKRMQEQIAQLMAAKAELMEEDPETAWTSAASLPYLTPPLPPHVTPPPPRQPSKPQGRRMLRRPTKIQKPDFSKGQARSHGVPVEPDQSIHLTPESRAILMEAQGLAQRSPSPVQRAPSPIRRSPSPVRRSPSPVRRSPSPVQRSPSPVRRSPSPSPQRRSPSPVQMLVATESPRVDSEALLQSGMSEADFIATQDQSGAFTLDQVSPPHEDMVEEMMESYVEEMVPETPESPPEYDREKIAMNLQGLYEEYQPEELEGIPRTPPMFSKYQPIRHAARGLTFDPEETLVSPSTEWHHGPDYFAQEQASPWRDPRMETRQVFGHDLEREAGVGGYLTAEDASDILNISPISPDDSYTVQRLIEIAGAADDLRDVCPGLAGVPVTTPRPTISPQRAKRRLLFDEEESPPSFAAFEPTGSPVSPGDPHFLPKIEKLGPLGSVAAPAQRGPSPRGSPVARSASPPLRQVPSLREQSLRAYRQRIATPRAPIVLEELVPSPEEQMAVVPPPWEYESPPHTSPSAFKSFRQITKPETNIEIDNIRRQLFGSPISPESFRAELEQHERVGYDSPYHARVGPQKHLVTRRSAPADMSPIGELPDFLTDEELEMRKRIAAAEGIEERRQFKFPYKHANRRLQRESPAPLLRPLPEEYISPQRNVPDLFDVPGFDGLDVGSPPSLLATSPKSMPDLFDMPMMDHLGVESPPQMALSPSLIEMEQQQQQEAMEKQRQRTSVKSPIREPVETIQELEAQAVADYEAELAATQEPYNPFLDESLPDNLPSPLKPQSDTFYEAPPHLQLLPLRQTSPSPERQVWPPRYKNVLLFEERPELIAPGMGTPSPHPPTPPSPPLGTAHAGFPSPDESTEITKKFEYDELGEVQREFTSMKKHSHGMTREDQFEQDEFEMMERMADDPSCNVETMERHYISPVRTEHLRKVVKGMRRPRDKPMMRKRGVVPGVSPIREELEYLPAEDMETRANIEGFSGAFERRPMRVPYKKKMRLLERHSGPPPGLGPIVEEFHYPESPVAGSPIGGGRGSRRLELRKRLKKRRLDFDNATQQFESIMEERNLGVAPAAASPVGFLRAASPGSPMWGSPRTPVQRLEEEDMPEFFSPEHSPTSPISMLRWRDELKKHQPGASKKHQRLREKYVPVKKMMPYLTEFPVEEACEKMNEELEMRVMAEMAAIAAQAPPPRQPTPPQEPFYETPPHLKRQALPTPPIAKSPHRSPQFLQRLAGMVTPSPPRLSGSPGLGALDTFFFSEEMPELEPASPEEAFGTRTPYTPPPMSREEQFEQDEFEMMERLAEDPNVNVDALGRQYISPVRMDHLRRGMEKAPKSRIKAMMRKRGVAPGVETIREGPEHLPLEDIDRREMIEAAERVMERRPIRVPHGKKMRVLERHSEAPSLVPVAEEFREQLSPLSRRPAQEDARRGPRRREIRKMLRKKRLDFAQPSSPDENNFEVQTFEAQVEERELPPSPRAARSPRLQSPHGWALGAGSPRTPVQTLEMESMPDFESPPHSPTSPTTLSRMVRTVRSHEKTKHKKHQRLREHYVPVSKQLEALEEYPMDEARVREEEELEALEAAEEAAEEATRRRQYTELDAPMPAGLPSPIKPEDFFFEAPHLKRIPLRKAPSPGLQIVPARHTHPMMFEEPPEFASPGPLVSPRTPVLSPYLATAASGLSSPLDYETMPDFEDSPPFQNMVETEMLAEVEQREGVVQTGIASRKTWGRGVPESPERHFAAGTPERLSPRTPIRMSPVRQEGDLDVAYTQVHMENVGGEMRRSPERVEYDLDALRELGLTEADLVDINTDDVDVDVNDLSIEMEEEEEVEEGGEDIDAYDKWLQEVEAENAEDIALYDAGQLVVEPSPPPSPRHRTPTPPPRTPESPDYDQMYQHLQTVDSKMTKRPIRIRGKVLPKKYKSLYKTLKQVEEVDENIVKDHFAMNWDLSPEARLRLRYPDDSPPSPIRGSPQREAPYVFQTPPRSDAIQMLLPLPMPSQYEQVDLGLTYEEPPDLVMAEQLPEIRHHRSPQPPSPSQLRGQLESHRYYDPTTICDTSQLRLGKRRMRLGAKEIPGLRTVREGKGLSPVRDIFATPPRSGLQDVAPPTGIYPPSPPSPPDYHAHQMEMLRGDLRAHEMYDPYRENMQRRLQVGRRSIPLRGSAQPGLGVLQERTPPPPTPPPMPRILRAATPVTQTPQRQPSPFRTPSPSPKASSPRTPYRSPRTPSGTPPSRRVITRKEVTPERVVEEREEYEEVALPFGGRTSPGIMDTSPIPMDLDEELPEDMRDFRWMD